MARKSEKNRITNFFTFQRYVRINKLVLLLDLFVWDGQQLSQITEEKSYTKITERRKSEVTWSCSFITFKTFKLV